MEGGFIFSLCCGSHLVGVAPAAVMGAFSYFVLKRLTTLTSNTAAVISIFAGFGVLLLWVVLLWATLALLGFLE